MRNVLLPSVPSQLFGFGNNEFQMQNMDFSMQMDTKLNHVHGIGTGFCAESNILSHGGFASPYHSLIEYQPAGLEACTLRSDIMSQQAIQIPQFEAGIETMKNARKRGCEHNGISKTASSEWKKIAKRKINATSSMEQESITIDGQNAHVPARRRSQKLGDKITALQKLVSAYGKADTASVLQEASLYIKQLHDQIQTMVQMMSCSHEGVAAASPRVGLRSRGLCLVPASAVEEATRES